MNPQGAATGTGRKRGRPLAAVGFVCLLGATLLMPLAHGAGSRASRAVARPAAQVAISPITAIDRIHPIAIKRLPKSAAPNVDILFVSCTHLWAAFPDGTHAHRILDMPGISSPTFAPSGRTIAFLASSGEGQGIYVADATGGNLRRVGYLRRDGESLDSPATALEWAPDGRRLAFALLAPSDDRAAASTIWTLNLSTGRFDKQGSGLPVPTFIYGQLTYPIWDDGKATLFKAHKSARVFTGRHPLAVAAAPGKLVTPGKNLAIVRAVHGKRVFRLRHDAYRHIAGQLVKPPPGERIAHSSRPALSQDGMTLYSTLEDGADQLDLGIYDIARRQWSVRDYAWSPATSSTPMTTSEPIDARRAVMTTDDLMRLWARGPVSERLLTGGHFDQSLLPFRPNFATGAPFESGDSWIVPVVAYGRLRSGFSYGYRTLNVHVFTEHRRLIAQPEPTGPIVPLDSVAAAAALLQRWVSTPVVVPSLPAGTRLDRNPISMWTYRGQTTGQLRLRVPSTAPTRRWGPPTVTLAYGGAYFAGCGEVHGKPKTLDGAPALIGHQAGSNSMVWPATRRSYRHSNGVEFGVSGNVPAAMVEQLAAEIQARL
ncbi:MAG: TolB family protein [Actinomycetota bacterium]